MEILDQPLMYRNLDANKYQLLLLTFSVDWNLQYKKAYAVPQEMHDFKFIVTLIIT